MGKGGGKGGEQMGPDGGAWYTCEFDCGYVGYYDAVCAHEKTCPKKNAPNGSGGKGGGMPTSEMYVCAFAGCNFLDTYANVERHEATCPLRPGAQAAMAAAQQAQAQAAAQAQEQ